MKRNLPNILVIVRFFLAFLVVLLLLLQVPLDPIKHGDLYVLYAGINVFYIGYLACFVFVLAAITDWLDGYLARKWNVVSTFGKIFDPLADKILVNSVLIIFTVFGRIPIWITIIFIVRDFLVDGLRIQLASQGKMLSAQKWGKYKTLFQFIGLTILFIIFTQPLDNFGFNYNNINALTIIPISIGMFFSLISGIVYYKNDWKFLFQNS